MISRFFSLWGVPSIYSCRFLWTLPARGDGLVDFIGETYPGTPHGETAGRRRLSTPTGRPPASHFVTAGWPTVGSTRTCS